MEKNSTFFQVRTKENEPDFDELMDMFRRRRDWFTSEQYFDAVYNHPLNFKTQSGSSYSKVAEYLFQCSICANIGMNDQWYRLILGTLGGSYFSQRNTLEEELIFGYTGYNLLKKLPDDMTCYQSSSIHHVKGSGYVCDHCMESVIDGN